MEHPYFHSLYSQTKGLLPSTSGRRTSFGTRICCGRWTITRRIGTGIGIITILSCLVLETILVHSVEYHRAVKLVKSELEGRPHLWEDKAWRHKVQMSAMVRKAGGYVVLVTGAAGFIGAHASLALSKKGYGVVGLDNFNENYDPTLKRQREAMLHTTGLFVVEGDINDEIMLKELFKMVTFTHVLHLAAQTGLRYAKENPQSYVQSNLAGLVSLLEVCAMANPQPAIVWASSSSVYGLKKKTPFSEDHPTDQPMSLYAATKKAGEVIIHAYNHIHQLSFTGLRFFTVYGPWGRPDMTVFRFTKAILEGEPVTIFQGRNITATRDWTFIDDIVTGCLAAIETAERSKGGRKNGKTMKSQGSTGPAELRMFNLGNRPVPVVEMVRILEKLLNRKAVILFEDMDNDGDEEITFANITLAQTHLGYYPNTHLSVGLRRFVEWYLHNYKVNPREPESVANMSASAYINQIPRHGN